MRETAVHRIMILFLAFWLAFQMKVTAGKAFFWFAPVLREINVLFMTVNGKLSDLWQQRMIQWRIGTSLRSVAKLSPPGEPESAHENEAGAKPACTLILLSYRSGRSEPGMAAGIKTR